MVLKNGTDKLAVPDGSIQVCTVEWAFSFQNSVGISTDMH